MQQAEKVITYGYKCWLYEGMNMSEIVIDVGYLQKYLRDIVRELNGIKFETTCFDMTGNISGLNAYVYAYSRISNFLVGYRSFARADIQNMCQYIEELINTDSELANTISGDSVELLISLNNDIGSISDAEGAISLPSIYTSSYILNYEDINRFNQIYREQVSELCDHILGYKNWIESFSNSGAIQGNTAESIIAYWNEVHIPIVDAILRIVLEINNRFLIYVNGLDALLSEREDCNIPQAQIESSIDEIYSLLNRIRMVSEGISGLVHSYYNSYSQLTSSNPNAELLIDMTQRTITEIQILDESIIEYENNQASLIKDYIDNISNEINNLISGVQSVNQSEYVSGGVLQISDYVYISSVLENTDMYSIERSIVDMYIEFANGDSNNLSNSQIRFIQNYIDAIATNRYQGTTNVLELRNECPDIISRYVQAYELLNPEQANLVRNFMSPIAEATTESNGYAQDIDNILYILYTADEPYRTVYINSTENISLHSIDYDGLANYYAPCNRIDLNLDELRNQSYPYITLFHEWAHGIDDVSIMLGSISTNMGRVHSGGKTVKDLVVEELTANIRNTLENLVISNNLELNDEEVQIVLNHLTSRQYIYSAQYPSDWTNAMRTLFDETRNYYGYYEYSYANNELTHSHISGLLSEEVENELYYIPLSDIFGALTNNELGGLSGHYFDDLDELSRVGMIEGEPYSEAQIGRFLTRYNYWFNSFGRTNHISEEFFAEYSSYQVIGVECCIESYRTITPNSALLIDACYSRFAGGDSYGE